MLPELADCGGGGYVLGDGEYDVNPVFDAAGAAGYQFVAPREDPKAGLGHRRQSPYRLRCIELSGRFREEPLRDARRDRAILGEATPSVAAWVRCRPGCAGRGGCGVGSGPNC